MLYLVSPLPEKSLEFGSIPAVLVLDFLPYFYDSPFGGHLGGMKTEEKCAVTSTLVKYASNTKHVTASQLLQSTEVQAPGEMIGVCQVLKDNLHPLEHAGVLGIRSWS